MSTVVQDKTRAQEAKVAVELTARQVALLHNLIEGAEDFGEPLPGPLEALRRELKEKAKALGLTFREGYAYLR